MENSNFSLSTMKSLFKIIEERKKGVFFSSIEITISEKQRGEEMPLKDGRYR